MPEEVISAKADNELPTVSKDKPEIIQEVNAQLEKSKGIKNDEKSKTGKSVVSKTSKPSQKK